MICRIAELQYKEVVDINDGTKFGFINDLELDTELGVIKNVIIYGKPRALGLLGRTSDTVFPWSSVRRIGSDLILVDTGNQKNFEQNKKI